MLFINNCTKTGAKSQEPITVKTSAKSPVGGTSKTERGLWGREFF